MMNSWATGQYIDFSTTQLSFIDLSWFAMASSYSSLITKPINALFNWKQLNYNPYSHGYASHLVINSNALNFGIYILIYMDKETSTQT